VRLIRLCAALLVLAISCSAEGGDPISVSQRGPGDLFAIIDNCPSVQAVTILAGGEILWSIERSSAAPENATIDIPLGRTPEGWNEVTPLIGGFEPGARYRLEVGPDEASLEFRLGDLNPGQAYDGQSSSPIGPRSELVTCEDVDGGGIDSFSEFLFTAALLLVLAFGIVGIVSWLVLKGLRRLVDRQAGDRLAREPTDDQWTDSD